ncbi:hypothetical protein [Streptosporangium sp. NPDC003464]
MAAGLDRGQATATLGAPAGGNGHPDSDPGRPVVAPPLAAEAGPMTRLDRLHRAVTRGDPANPEAACGLTTAHHSGRLDPTQAIPVDQADPALPCPVGGCRMRAWPPTKPKIE